MFVWAGGNGAQSQDNCNFDGFANSRFAIAVGALADTAQPAFYSEPCAALFLTAAGGPRGLTTTDIVGANGYSSTDYTSTFGGTSAATPVVSGTVSLMLSRNPSLTARDVKHILARTAVKLNPGDAGWSPGRHAHNENLWLWFSRRECRCQQADRMAARPPRTGDPARHADRQHADSRRHSGWIAGFHRDRARLRELPSRACGSGIHRHSPVSRRHRGHANVSGRRRQPTRDRRLADSSPDGYSAWRFRAVRHWGETAAGTWTLRVSDGFEEQTGTWNNWTLRIFGTQPAAPASRRAAGDFDGDGRSDFAVFRRRSGEWFIQNDLHPSNLGFSLGHSGGRRL